MSRSPAAHRLECPHYEPIPGAKRCRSFVEGGACARLDMFMCVEWLKVNSAGPTVSKDASAPALRCRQLSTEAGTERGAEGKDQRDLFGHHVRPTPPKTPLRKLPAPHLRQARPVTSDEVTEERPDFVDLASIESLAATGLQVCVRFDGSHEGLWLVPEPSGLDRPEMTYRQAATLAAVCAAFPGAQVIDFRRGSGERS